MCVFMYVWLSGVDLSGPLGGGGIGGGMGEGEFSSGRDDVDLMDNRGGRRGPFFAPHPVRISECAFLW